MASWGEYILIRCGAFKWYLDQLSIEDLASEKHCDIKVVLSGPNQCRSTIRQTLSQYPHLGYSGTKNLHFFSSFYYAACILYLFFKLVIFLTIECGFVHQVFAVC